MKKTVLLFVLCSLFIFMGYGQSLQLTKNHVLEIANRNASALWGTVYADEPIPYYSAKDEIIAYRINYSIEQSFPERKDLISRCNNFKQVGEENSSWGIGNYGRMLIGATDSLPVIIEYANALSIEYVWGQKIQEKANEMLGTGNKLDKIYYINYSNQWFCYSNNNNKIYINPFPPLRAIDQSAFDKMVSETKVFITPADYSKEWEQYLAGKSMDTKAQVFIPDLELCPYYDWSYGCSPTAAAMLLGWWDYHSINSSWDFAKLIDCHFDRFDIPENEWDYGIPWLQRILAIEMDTDTTTGNTQYLHDIKNGVEDAAATRGYEFDGTYHVTLEWTYLKDEIDDNRPCIASIPGHSTTGVGYDNSNDHFACHDTYVGTYVWMHKDELDGIVEFYPETDGGQGITLTSPIGDPGYNSTGNGEIFYPGNTYNITWEYENNIASKTLIGISDCGFGCNFEHILTNDTENDGEYSWIVPAFIGSEQARVRIANYDLSDNYLGADCSKGRITIYTPPSIPLLSKGVVETADFSPDYYRAQHNDNEWYVIAVRNFSDEDWDLDIFEDVDFTSKVESSQLSPAVSGVDFVVFDGHHASEEIWRVKIEAAEGETSGKIVYNENGDVNLGSQTVTFPVGSVAKMYEAHLMPGYYTFSLNMYAGSGDANMALFNSGNGDYLQNLDDAMAISNTNGNGVEEAFTIFINNEDDYGLCIWTPTPSSSNWELIIEEEIPGVWEGDHNNYWSDANNWSLNMVPDITTNVVIPAGTPYSPYTLDPAFCASVTIESGANLNVSTGELVVAGDLLNKGFLRIYADRTLTVAGDITWTSTATEDFRTNSLLNIGGNWTFDYGCAIQLDEGTVRFASYTTSSIYCRSNESWFNNVEVDKMEPGWVNVEMTPGLQPLRIYGNFNGLAGQFWSASMFDIIFRGLDLNVTDDFEFSCTEGSFVFNRSGNQYLYFNPESYFHNLVIDCGGNVYLQDPILVEFDVVINTGVLASNSHTIEVGGDWRNNVGPGAFYQSSGRVIFNGYSIQECDGEEFHILEMNKTLGELRFHEGVTVCDEYDFTSGSMRVNGGSFTANDLTDDGLFGDIYVTSGDMTLTQDAFGFIDLRGNLTITDGVITIYGGGDDSYWPYLADVAFTMSGGVLDIVDNGIEVRDAGNLFDEDISGGTIRTAYDFVVNRSDFFPTGGIIEMYGANVANLFHEPGSALCNLLINKSSKEASSGYYPRKHRTKKPHLSGKAPNVNATSDLLILGNLTISSGTLVAPPLIEIVGDWNNLVGDDGFDQGTGTVSFWERNSSVCTYGETFCHLVLDRQSEFNTDHLILPEGTATSCQTLEWISGGLELDGGDFVAFDLVNDGIYGQNIINDGLMRLYQGTGAGEYVDLNGELILNGGQLSIYGGADDSYWTFNGFASITMTGVSHLWFHDVGIRIYDNPSFAFTEDINGGLIHTASHFICERPNFNPEDNSLIMQGGDDAVLSMELGSTLSTIQVTKSSKDSRGIEKPLSPRIKVPIDESKANSVTTLTDIYFTENFMLVEGSFLANHDLFVGAHWQNNVGTGAFIENNSTVTFYGDLNSTIFTDEDFFNLICLKNNEDNFLSTVESLSVNVLNNFEIGYGMFQPGSGSNIQISNDVTFEDGGSWYVGDTQVEIGGDWKNNNTTTSTYTGFHPGTSIVTFNGLEHQYFLSNVPIEEFNDLIINKAGGVGNDSFEPQANIRVLNDLDIIAGNWYDTPIDNIHEFYGDILISVDGRWTDPDGIVRLLGSEPQSMINNGSGYFAIVMFDKENDTDPVTFGGNMIFDYLNINKGDVTIPENYYLNHEAVFVEANASLTLDAGVWMVSDDEARIHISEGGEMYINGEDANHCVITQNGGSGYYDFDVYGTLSAEYTEFRMMSAQGIFIHPEGQVSPSGSFTNCIFSDGETTGTYLTINNDQNIVADGITFQINNWGGNSNVRKSLNQGNITFANFNGDFSGEAFDDDVYNRIYWDEGIRELDLVILLEGPFSGSFMETLLNSDNLIPFLQPYNTTPWNYSGSESVTAIPNPDIVDWVLLEYRDAVDASSAIPATIIGRQAAFILNDGSIVDLDGTSLPNFIHTINEQLFIVVYHRNHLPVMSATALTETSGIFSYDFTTSVDQAHGSNSMKNLGGSYGLYAGDANGDGMIDHIDRTSFIDPKAGTKGYLKADFDMDGQVNNLDKNDFWVPNLNIYSNVPE